MYPDPAIVLGSGQKNEMRPPAAALPIITRDSGGGAVAAGPWLVSASVVLPAAHPLVSPSLVKSYEWIGEAHARVLRALGVNAAALSPAEVTENRAKAEREVRWACFGSLSPWEVTVGGRKIVGLAQVRRRHGALLVAGTLIRAADWRLLASTMQRPPEEADRLSELTTNCETELGRRLPADVFASALDEELRVRTR
jgi:lipoate-protein ligase A